MTTVSVYSKTSSSLPLNTGENVLEIGPPNFSCGPCAGLVSAGFHALIQNLLPHVGAVNDK